MQSISKKYGELYALKDVELEIKERRDGRINWK